MNWKKDFKKYSNMIGRRNTVTINKKKPFSSWWSEPKSLISEHERLILSFLNALVIIGDAE